MNCSWPFIVSVIIPDTALTEMTVREAAAIDKQQITSGLSHNRLMLICRAVLVVFFITLCSALDWSDGQSASPCFGSQATTANCLKTALFRTSGLNQTALMCSYRAGPPAASPRRCASHSSSCTRRAGCKIKAPLGTVESGCTNH